MLKINIMPGPHFNSKRLKNARNVRAEFAPGSVPRVGAPGFRLRLLPRTVEKNCGCSVRAPPSPPSPTTITLYTARLQNNNQVVDMLDAFGNDPTNISFIHQYDLEVGDVIIYIHPTSTLGEQTTTVASVSTANGRKNMIELTDAHNISNSMNDGITITLPL